MGEQEIGYHRRRVLEEAGLSEDMQRKVVYAESVAHTTLPRPPQLAALLAVMVGNEEELEGILEEMRLHDLGRLVVYCERLKRAALSKRQDRLHGTHGG